MLSMHSCLSLNNESAGMSGRQGQRRMGIVILLNKYSLGQEMKLLFFLLSLSLTPATVYIIPYVKQDDQGGHRVCFSPQHESVGRNEQNKVCVKFVQI